MNFLKKFYTVNIVNTDGRTIGSLHSWIWFWESPVHAYNLMRDRLDETCSYSAISDFHKVE